MKRLTRKHRLGTAFAVAFTIAAATGTTRAETFQVEIDYMGSNGGHDHMPPQIVLDAVVQMFACQGHTLVLDLDDEITHYNTLVADPNTACGNFWTYTGAVNTYRSIRDQNFDNGDGWHYCIFAHDYQSPNGMGGCNTGSSGRANGGDALIVTLGSFDGSTGTLYAQAATFAHELGHNLGLSHCGSGNCASNNFDGSASWVGPFVPNLPSVMSYQYQLAGVRTNMLALGLTHPEALFKDVDYSHGRMCPLDEDDLNEVRGTVMQSVDWDCDGVLENSVAEDINGGQNSWCATEVNRTFVSDRNEWGNLSDGAKLAASGAPADVEELKDRAKKLEKQVCIDALTWDLIKGDLINAGFMTGGGPTLVVENCFNGENVFVGDVFFFEFGTCLSPFGDVQTAQQFSPSGSAYFFTPDTYDEAGVTLLNKRGKYFSPTGATLIR